MLLQMALCHSLYDWEIFVCVCVYHIFFIPLSVSAQLGRFHVLAVVSSAVKIGVRVSCAVRVVIWMHAQQWDCRVTWWFWF